MTFAISQLSKSYNRKLVVQDVDLSIPEGKVTAFIGPNGAGKSTVLHMISRLLEHDGGQIHFQNKDLGSWDTRELAQHLAILTQDNQTQLKLTVRDLVAFGRFPHSGGRLNPQDHIKIEEAIAYMALGDYQGAYLDELSGGQRQRAYIAMVIAQDTDYILLDEPTNNLDVCHAKAMMQLIRRLADDLGKTVLIVLHDINYAAFYSDHIIAMKDGRIQTAGPVEEVITTQTLSQLYNLDVLVQDHHGKKLCIYY
jgi:iron complex transport system ATP-binding protein